MNRIFFGLVLIGLLHGCSDNDSGKNSSKDSPAGNANQVESKRPDNTGIPDFLKVDKDRTTEYKGYLQGVNMNDSAGPYIYKEYYGDTLSFELFYLPKSREKSAITFDSVKTAAQNDYRDYTLVAFTFPMQNPDYSKENIKYPVHVKSYVRKEEKWWYLSEQTVKDISELSQFRIKTIYSAIK